MALVEKAIAVGPFVPLILLGLIVVIIVIIVGAVRSRRSNFGMRHSISI